MREPALIHSHTAWLSRGVSMPRSDQRALHLGSGIISLTLECPKPSTSRIISASLPSQALHRNPTLVQAHPTRIKRNSFDVA